MSNAPVGSFSVRIRVGQPSGCFELTCDKTGETTVWEELEPDSSCEHGDLKIRQVDTGEVMIMTTE